WLFSTVLECGERNDGVDQSRSRNCEGCRLRYGLADLYHYVHPDRIQWDGFGHRNRDIDCGPGQDPDLRTDAGILDVGRQPCGPELDYTGRNFRHHQRIRPQRSNAAGERKHYGEPEYERGLHADRIWRWWPVGKRGTARIRQIAADSAGRRKPSGGRTSVTT